MADTTDLVNAQDPQQAQPDQNQAAQPVSTQSGPLSQEELADLVPVEDSEKVLPGVHSASATSDLVPVEGTEKKLSLPKETKVQASGVVGPTSMGAREGGFHSWLQDVQADVKNGSATTWFGAMLKKLGAKGTDYGIEPRVGDFMAGPVLGVPKALEGASEVAGQLDEGVRNSNMDYGKTVRGVNKVIGGAFQSLGPAAVAAPGGEALAVVVPAMVAAAQAGKAAEYMGADPDTKELIENITGLYAGGKIHESLHPVIERFGVAVNNRTAAEQEYTSRARELETARGQAAEMQQRAHDAVGKETAGQGTPADTDAARTAASEAAKNVANAQKAFEQAQARRADATIQVDKLGRQITKSADKTTASEYEAKASEQKKASDFFQKAVPSKGANRYSPEDEDIARAHMEAAKAKGAKIVDLPSAYEAVEGGRQGIEDQLKPHLEKYDQEALTDKPEDSPKMRVASKLAEMAKVDGNFEDAMDSLSEFNITDPTVGEAQDMLTKLNNYNRAAMKGANNWDIYNMIETKPDFAARFFMADELRDALYSKLESHGVEGAREARGETASLIRVRDAIGAQIRANRGGTAVRGSGTQSKLRLLTAKLTGKAIKGAGIAGGAEMGGPVGAVAGGAVGEMVAQPVEDFLAPRDMTRDQHIEKSMKYKGTNRKPVEIKGPGTPPVVPTEPIPPAPKDMGPAAVELTPRENTELHAELAAHYGESNLEDSTYAELEQRLREDVAAKNRSGVALESSEKNLLTKVLKADSADRAITQAAGKPGVEVKIDPKKEDEIIKEADQRAEEGEPTKLNPHLVSLGRGDESALVSHSPAMKAHAPAMPVPGLSDGLTTEDAHLHEWAHTAIGSVDGLEPVEIRSDLHPKSDKGAGATAVFNGAMLRDANGNIDPEALGKQETQWLTQKMAGPASHEVFKGMTREEVKASPASRSDFRTSRAMVREVHPDFTAKQVEAVVDAAYDRARDFLTKPHIADRIRANAAVREEGLSHTLHASHGRVNQFAEDIRNAHSEYTGGESGPDGDGAGESGEKAKKPAAEGKEKNAGGDKSGVGEGTPKPADKLAATSRESKVKKGEIAEALSPEKLKGAARAGFVKSAWDRVSTGKKLLFSDKPGTLENKLQAEVDAGNIKSQKDLETKVNELSPREVAESKIVQAPELRVPFKEGRTNPPERTTGEYDEPIKKGGAIPGGIQKGDEEIGLKDLALFHDPTTGSTLALPTDKITPENVKAQLQKSRDLYLKANPEQSRIPTPGQPGYDEEIHGTGRSNVPATDDLVGQAVKHYGTTDEPRKTGYILPDGRGLDFSDGQQARTLDHGDVSEVMKTERGENPRAAFTNKTGAARFMQSSFGTEVVVPESGATDEQMKFIADAALQHPKGSKELSIDLLSGSGEVIGSARRAVEGVEDVQRAVADARRDANDRNAGFGKEGAAPYDYYQQNWKGQARSAFDDLIGDPTKAVVGAVKSAKDWVKKAVKTEGDGFSFHPVTGEAPTDGYMVETELNRGQSFDHPPTAEDIRQFVAKNRDVLEQNPDLYVGGYKNTLGLSKKFADRAGAEELGKNTNQISIYDVAAGKEIPTGGTGEVTPEMVAQSNIGKKYPKGSSVPLMDNPLPVKGTMEGDEVGTLDITKALNKFSRKSNPALEPGSEPKEMVDRAKKIAEDEAKYQLAQSKTGTEWYTTEMKDHDKVLQDLRPELAEGETTGGTDGHPVNLTLFKAAEAILSSGQKPYANVKSALRAWDHYKETGEFAPTNPANGKSWGPRNVAAYGNAFESMNRLIKEKGEKGAVDWLLAEHPVSELKQYNPEGVSGKKTDQAAGAMILGQKRGPFMQNLHGIESKFTADMWVSRTWNRWMGTLDLDPRIEDKGKVTSESDAPRNNAERSLMKESFEKTAQKLNLTTSSLQAVLWYYEQALYRAHGISVESWSFSDAAKRVAAEAKAVPEAEQTGFNFGENAKEKGGMEGLAGRQPQKAAHVTAFDLINALKKKAVDNKSQGVVR